MATAASAKNALTPANKPRSNPMVNKLKKELDAKEAARKRLLDRMRDGKETVARTGLVLLNQVETGSTLLLSSIAEGRWGSKMKLGGKVDVRLIPGIPMLLAGIWMTATGHGGASHVLSIGEGFIWSLLGSTGQDIGRAWGEKMGGEPATRGDADVGSGDADLGELRELVMTDSEVETGRRAPSDVARNRFRSVEAI